MSWLIYKIRWWKWFLIDSPGITISEAYWRLSTEDRRIIRKRQMAEWETKEPKR